MITIPLRAIGRVILIVSLATVLVLGVRSYTEGYWPFCCDENRWTGVFLTNGQAYFGHYYDGPGEYVKLYDVYYVLATQLQSQDPKVASQTQLSLQKLGGEIHGPEPWMRISKQQVLFLEDLRADSPVVQSIRALKQGGAQPPQQQPAATASPSPTR